MPETVKSRRNYDATGRREQAHRTRAAVLTSAREQFLAAGYTATTMASVARAARVSTQQIYKTFGNKAGLVKAVFDVAIAGDDEPTVMVERSALTGVRQEPNPYVKLRRYAAFVADTAPRHVPVQLLVRVAADSDADAARIWHDLCDERLHGMGMFARDLAPHLRPGVSVEQARDVLWTYNSPELWDLLVTGRGWSPDRFSIHLAETLIDALLPREGAISPT